MRSYKISLLESGGMKSANHLQECSDDYEAMALANNLIKGGGIAHIWEGTRSVGQIFLPLPIAAE